MKRSWVKQLIAALSLSALLVACIADEEDVVGERIVVGDSLPGFEVTMSDGSVVTSDWLSEGTSLVLFFHTLCPDCQQVLPIVQQVYDEYLPRGVRFAAISREEDAASVEAYWEANGLDIPYSPQTDRAIYELFATSRIPRVYINRDGVVNYIFTDNPVPTYQEVVSALEEMLN